MACARRAKKKNSILCADPSTGFRELSVGSYLDNSAVVLQGYILEQEIIRKT